jgi:hypothetical protein
MVVGLNDLLPRLLGQIALPEASNNRAADRMSVI